ncbi:MAG: phosphate ABC transporter permease PstA [Bacillota bacterium]|nr:MAG: phosphate ABC transporter permease PtsA [Bacillota bacterium]
MTGEWQRRRRARQRLDRIFAAVFLLAIALSLLTLAVLFWDVVRDGARWLRWEFLTGYPSRIPERAGILVPLVGSLWVIGLTALLALPLGVAAAIYLEFYAGDSWLSRLIEANIANLAGVPSIVYGLLGLAVFVRGLHLGRSVLAAALTMTLLVLPVIIVATREALRAVPLSLIHGAYALGATRWQVIRTVVLPTAAGSIMTGVILAISRALGETAPLITVGAWAFITYLPRHPLDGFSVLPIQIFNWAARPKPAFQQLAAAGIIVLLAVLLSLNAVAIWLRNKYQKKAEW